MANLLLSSKKIFRKFVPHHSSVKTHSLRHPSNHNYLIHSSQNLLSLFYKPSNYSLFLPQWNNHIHHQKKEWQLKKELETQKTIEYFSILAIQAELHFENLKMFNREKERQRITDNQILLKSIFFFRLYLLRKQRWLQMLLLKKRRRLYRIIRNFKKRLVNSLYSIRATIHSFLKKNETKDIRLNKGYKSLQPNQFPSKLLILRSISKKPNLAYQNHKHPNAPSILWQKHLHVSLETYHSKRERII